jgi:hypothetical protein
VRQNTGQNPEDFKIEDKITTIKKKLKNDHKKMIKHDTKIK